MVRRIGRIGRKMMLGLAATGMVLTAGAANAQDDKLLPGISADEIVGIMTEYKIQSQQLPLSGNDPTILGMLPSGAKFFVHLADCAAQAASCQVIQFGAIFTGAELPMADFNAFNSRYTFGKAYQDAEKKMYVHHAVIVAEGIRRKAVKVNMLVFFDMAAFFTKFLSERMGSVSASADAPAGDKPDAITNMAGKLPANSTLASFRKTATKHPEIVNTLAAKGTSKWKVK